MSILTLLTLFTLLTPTISINYNCKPNTGTFTLDASCATDATINVNNQLSIIGSTTSVHSISGGKDHQIFDIGKGDTLILKDLELKNGYAKETGKIGGAIRMAFNGIGDFTFVVFSNNFADSGGALAMSNDANAKVVGCRFEKNTCDTQGNDVYVASATAAVKLGAFEKKNLKKKSYC